MSEKKNKLDNLTPYQKGQTGNPGGKPINARNRIQTKFLETLADDFEKHGQKAIKECREQKPDAYIRAIASLMPKELEIKKPLDEINDADLSAAIALLQSVIASQGADGGAGEESGTQKAH